MSRRSLLITLATLLPAVFLAGFFVSRTLPGAKTSRDREVLYYVDPMNPSFRSPEPGTAPCGMPLEPVYADSAAATEPGAAASAGSIAVRADRRQLIGVTVEIAQVQPLHRTARLPGKVAVDDRRLYRISAVTAGWVREIGLAATGSRTTRGEVLAAYYTPEIATAQQTLLYTLNTYDKLEKPGAKHADQMAAGGQFASYEKNVQILRQSLLNLGMTPEQIEEIEMSRRTAQNIQIRAPAAGFILARNLSMGERFEAGTELYRIADLSQVWIVADAFEGDEALLPPGATATVRRPGQALPIPARVSQALPQFDAATRTLKVRLEAENPGFVLRPGMFVDVEVSTDTEPVISVPRGAVLDSGTRRVVFVEKEEGVFEPRRVTTGRRFGDRVEILGGIMAGEQVVASGNFLLDSESRMRAAAAAPIPAGMATDPVCGMDVDESRARAAGLTQERAGETFYFCAPACKTAFEKRAAAAKHDTPPMTNDTPGAMSDSPASARDPVCGMAVDEKQARSAGLTSTHAGASYFFCSPTCKQAFDADPAAHAPPSR